MSRAKAGKKAKGRAKVAPRKAAPRSTPKRKQPAHASSRPAAAAAPAAEAKKFSPGCVALVTRGADRTPVQVRDQAHLDELCQKHGAQFVEVQS